jgi:hypothetical protein
VLIASVTSDAFGVDEDVAIASKVCIIMATEAAAQTIASTTQLTPEDTSTFHRRKAGGPPAL